MSFHSRGTWLVMLLSCTALIGPVQAQKTAPAAAKTASKVPPASATPNKLASIKIDIPTEEFTLPNGLRVIVNTDRKTPIVSVNILYKVGSRNEQPGRTGFAHLFEHLMFQGSENFKDEFFRPFELVGTSGQNGGTDYDWTYYYENVPTPALDMALWMESDRMGHLLGAVDQANLDEQRGVVQNEKRQRANAPYATARDYITEALYPGDHPYGHTPIGSMVDLNAATLDDVKAWFKSWYGPNNAVLILSGDIDLATAKEKVARYFGDIPASGTVQPMKPNVRPLAADKRNVVHDKATRAYVIRTWPAPEKGTEDAVLLEFVGNILGGNSESSRLVERLVRRDKIIDAATANYNGLDLAGMFVLSGLVKEGVKSDVVEDALNQELQRFLADGPTAEELHAVQMATMKQMVDGIQYASSKALAISECVSQNRPTDCWRDRERWVASATPEKVRDAARRWLGKPSYVLIMDPGNEPAKSPFDVAAKQITPPPMVIPPVDPRFSTLPSTVDRSAGVPKVDGFPKFSPGLVQRATLSNGVKVVLSERHDAPAISVTVSAPMVESRPNVDPRGIMALVAKGAGKYTAASFQRRLQELGATFFSNSFPDWAGMNISTLSPTLNESLDLLADALFRPTFPQSEIDLSRALDIAGLKQAYNTPAAVPLVASRLLYGKGTPNDFLPSEAYFTTTRQEMIAYYHALFRPERSTIIVAGDTTLEQLLPMLEARFGKWKAEGPAVPSIKIADAPRPSHVRVFLIDQPGATQSTVSANLLVPSSKDPNADALDAATGALGGYLTSRLMMNLREGKHWSYGATANARRSPGQRMWTASSAVQADKTADAMREMFKEIDGMAGGKAPVTEIEMVRNKAKIYTLPAGFEGVSSGALTISDNLRYGRPDDYLEQLVKRLAAMSPAEAQAAFASQIDTKTLTWIVMGPLDQIEAPIRALKMGEVIVIDGEGKRIR